MGVAYVLVRNCDGAIRATFWSAKSAQRMLQLLETEEFPRLGAFSLLQIEDSLVELFGTASLVRVPAASSSAPAWP
jgi:hypothetical protein